MTYQKPVQGMRAFAVLIVVLNHLGIAGFSGGFIGVDVFFVISGYLITGLLVEEYNRHGSISISGFYARRIKRILPALMVTIVVTSLLGFLLLSEERFGLLIDSALASMFSVSNIYFWSQIGYFDSSAIEKPLLHTWSLGVEEQFYLVWPVMVIVLAKLGGVKSVIYGVLAISLVSFFSNMYVLGWGMPEALYTGDGFRSWFANEKSAVFYLMPFRIFEFGIGAALGILYFQNQPKVSRFLSDGLFLLAAATLILATWWLDKTSAFPFHNALLVSVAAALVIYASYNSMLASYLLSNKVMVFIGAISYSFYLVHWPVITYYSLIFGFPSLVESACLFVVMLVLAWLIFEFIEQPARKVRLFPALDKGFYQVIPKIFVIVCIVGMAYVLSGMKGIEWRIPESRKTLTNSQWRAMEQKAYCRDAMVDFPESIFTCQNDRGSEKTVIAWGDSHANHLVAGLSEVFGDFNIAISYVSSCIPQSGFNGLVRSISSGNRTQKCIDRNHAFLDWAESYRGELLIFITSAKRNEPQQISEINDMLINRLEEAGHDVYVLGDFIRPGNEIAQCRSVPSFLLSDKSLEIICRPDFAEVNRELSYSKTMEEISRNYIPVHASQCPDDNCRFSDDQGRATFRDHHHLSAYGSIYEMRMAADLIQQHVGIDLVN